MFAPEWSKKCIAGPQKLLRLNFYNGVFSLLLYFSIKDVSMDIAVKRDTGQGRAVFVEECNCPREFQGLSCEVCCDYGVLFS